MTHSPQRNEVEDRGADTYLSICFLYLPYCRGVEFQNGPSQTRFVVSIHTTVRGGCGESRDRSASADANRALYWIFILLLFAMIFAQPTWLGAVPTPVSEAESSGVPRVARVAVGGASRAVPRPRRATCLIMRYRHIALDKYRRIVRPPPRRPRHARPRPAAALCDGGVGGPRTCLGLLWVSLQPATAVSLCFS